MNGRFAPAVIAFAVATAVASHAKLLPEFLVQIGDPNLLGGAVYAFAIKTLGYAFVLSLCAVLAGGATLLVSWRARVRGASDWHASLAAILMALCLTGRVGVSLDPIGWVCAAAFCLLLDRDDAAGVLNALAIVAVWSLLQGGATLAAVLAVVALIGALIDARRIDETVRRKTVLAAGSCVLGLLQLHGAPWHAYGAHALYLDSFFAGAQRDRIFNGGLTVSGLGIAALLTVAAWYGVRRRARAADALTFFVMLVLALADARNLPYFGIAAAPLVADAVASYYVNARTFPDGSVRQYFVTFCACAFAFIAVLTSTEPKVAIWPQSPEQPGALLAKIANDRQSHTLLCVRPRWCDGVSLVFSRVHPILDDRAGLASRRNRRIQADVAKTTGAWRSELRSAHVDAIIAHDDDDLVALLAASGWRQVAAEGSQILLRPEKTQ